MRDQEPLDWSRHCIGISQHQNSFRCVLATRGRWGGCRLRAIEPDEAAIRIAETQIPLAAIAPVSLSYSRWLTSPIRSRRKARKALPHLLDVDLPFAIDECVYTFPVIDSGVGDTRALAVCALHRTVSDLLDTIGQSFSGDVLRLDHEGLALWSQSLAERAAGNAEEERLAIAIENSGATLAWGVGARLRALRATPRADAETLTRAALTLAQSQAEHPNPPRLLICWAGSNANDPTLVESIENELSSALSPRYSTQSYRHEQPAHLLARAAARRALCADALPCNLLTESSGLMPKRLERSIRLRRIRLQAATSAAALFLMAAAWTARVAAERRLAAANAQFSQALTSILDRDTAARGSQALLMAERRHREWSAAFAPIRRAVDDSTPARFSALAGHAASESATLSKLTVSGNAVAIEGRAPLAAPTEFAAALTGTEWRSIVKTRGIDGDMKEFSFDAHR